VTEAKLKEEAIHIYRNVDVKLDKNKKDIQNLLADFKNSVTLDMKRQENPSNNNIQDLQQDKQSNGTQNL
jgi:hypothetical protein